MSALIQSHKRDLLQKNIRTSLALSVSHTDLPDEFVGGVERALQRVVGRIDLLANLVNIDQDLSPRPYIYGEPLSEQPSIDRRGVAAYLVNINLLLLDVLDDLDNAARVQTAVHIVRQTVVLRL